jgi:cell filamentation protein
MSKWITQQTRTGAFVIGRASAEKFSAVEGQFRSARTSRLIAESDAKGESGDAKRARILREFSAKK